MGDRRRVLILLAAFLVLSGSVLVVPSARAPSTTRTWVLAGDDFLNGTFQNSTVSNLALQLGARLPPTNRTMVLDVGSPGSPDSAFIFAPSVLRETDGTYKMWYTGNGGGYNSILYATSPNGVNWTKVGVVLEPTPNGGGIPSVLKIGSTYHMWYEATTWGVGPIGYTDQIYHATSPNGVTWTVQGLALDLGANGTWDSAIVGDADVVAVAGGYRMYYTGWNDAGDGSIGVATSTNLVNWTRYAGNPVLPFGAAGTWESANAARASVMLMGSTWVMYYNGNVNGSKPQIGRAASPDGYSWTKDGNNPIIGPEPSPAWDSLGVMSSDLVMLPSGPVLYFAGQDSTAVRIGLLLFTPPPSRTDYGGYTSAVFDSGALGTTWLSLTADATVPSRTTMDLRARVGNGSTPDATWAAWTSASAAASLPRRQYAQVAVNFTSTAWNVTPTVMSITLGYALDQAPSATPWSPSPDAWTNGSRPALRWNLSDPEGDPVVAERVQVSLFPNFFLVNHDSGNLTPGTTSWQAPFLTDGIWYWRVQAEDGYGAWSNWTTSQVLIDTTPPKLSVSSPYAGGLLHASMLDVIWNASDGLSGLDHFTVSLDSGTPQRLGPGESTTVLTGVPDGGHTVRVTAFDRAGNPASVTLSFSVDTGILSVNGPYGAWPLVALVAAVVVAAALVTFVLWRRRKRPPAQQPAPPGTP